MGGDVNQENDADKDSINIGADDAYANQSIGQTYVNSDQEENDDKELCSPGQVDSF